MIIEDKISLYIWDILNHINLCLCVCVWLSSVAINNFPRNFTIRSVESYNYFDCGRIIIYQMAFNNVIISSTMIQWWTIEMKMVNVDTVSHLNLLCYRFCHINFVLLPVFLYSSKYSEYTLSIRSFSSISFSTQRKCCDAKCVRITLNRTTFHSLAHIYDPSNK